MLTIVKCDKIHYYLIWRTCSSEDSRALRISRDFWGTESVQLLQMGKGLEHRPAMPRDTANQRVGHIMGVGKQGQIWKGKCFWLDGEEPFTHTENFCFISSDKRNHRIVYIREMQTTLTSSWGKMGASTQAKQSPQRLDQWSKHTEPVTSSPQQPQEEGLVIIPTDRQGDREHNKTSCWEAPTLL